MTAAEVQDKARDLMAPVLGLPTTNALIGQWMPNPDWTPFSPLTVPQQVPHARYTVKIMSDF